MSRFTKILKISTGVWSVAMISYFNREKFESKIFAASPVLQKPIKDRQLWDSNWDYRKYSDDSKAEDGQKKKRQKRFIILIRHGQYHTEGNTDVEHKLTTLGREQARMTGARLKELGIPFTRIIHSTMTRARETAEIIHEALPEVPMTQCSLLEEGCPIEPEPPSKNWRPPYYQFHRDGARIEAAFRKYFHRADPSQESDTYEIIVCHANVIRYFVCRALQLPPEAWLRFSLHHASLTSLVIYDAGKVSLRSYGDAGYMPPHALTTS